MTLFLGAFAAPAASSRILLDVAPSAQMSDLVRALNPAGYLAIDFDPGADGRLVDVAASLTDLPLPDACVGLMVCYHVLEHIPDDKAAMGEIARVLAADGVALVQVPWRAGATDEDPSASPEERLRRFGQADHVRYYGDDFERRLEDAGLRVSRLVAADVTPDPLITLFGLDPGEVVWVCTPAAADSPDLHGAGEAVRESLVPLLDRTVRRELGRRRTEASAASEPEVTPTAGPAARRWYRSAAGSRSGRMLADLTRPLRQRLRR
jgi:SAM-dependent methyltransferase